MNSVEYNKDVWEDLVAGGRGRGVVDALSHGAGHLDEYLSRMVRKHDGRPGQTQSINHMQKVYRVTQKVSRARLGGL